MSEEKIKTKLIKFHNINITELLIDKNNLVYTFFFDWQVFDSFILQQKSKKWSGFDTISILREVEASGHRCCFL